MQTQQEKDQLAEQQATTISNDTMPVNALPALDIGIEILVLPPHEELNHLIQHHLRLTTNYAPVSTTPRNGMPGNKTMKQRMTSQNGTTRMDLPFSYPA